MQNAEAAQRLCSRFRDVYTSRLRTVTRPDGKSVVTVPQPTLEGGDIAIFVDATDGRVVLHDNERTAVFLESLGVDLRGGRKAQLERLAMERGCEYRLGRLQTVYSATEDGATAALGLVDAIKTASDLGLQARPKPAHARGLAARVKTKLFEWYPTAVHTPWRIRGEVADHVVEFAVANRGRYCIVKPVGGRAPLTQAASWLGAWRDIWLGHAFRVGSGSNGLVGAVSIYPGEDLATGEADVIRDILCRLGPEHIAVPSARDEDYRDAIESVFRGAMLQP